MDNISKWEYMQIKEIADKLGAKVLTSHDLLEKEVIYAFSTDLLSDLLKLDKTKILLITGLATIQTIRACEVTDIIAILLVRGKKATPEMIELANQNKLVLMEYPGSMFKASGLLYQYGILPVY
jgi:predicted transcriptional regulator